MLGQSLREGWGVNIYHHVLLLIKGLRALDQIGLAVKVFGKIPLMRSWDAFLYNQRNNLRGNFTFYFLVKYEPCIIYNFCRVNIMLSVQFLHICIANLIRFICRVPTNILCMCSEAELKKFIWKDET